MNESETTTTTEKQEANSTPDWQADSIGHEVYEAERMTVICTLPLVLPNAIPERIERARLIAAAPQMLAELWAKEAWIVDYVPEGVTGREAELAAVRAAIAEATGRAA